MTEQQRIIENMQGPELEQLVAHGFALPPRLAARLENHKREEKSKWMNQPGVPRRHVKLPLAAVEQCLAAVNTLIRLAKAKDIDTGPNGAGLNELASVLRTVIGEKEGAK